MSDPQHGASLSALVRLHRELVCAADADVQNDVAALLDSFVLASRHADDQHLNLPALRAELNRAIAAMQCFDLLSQRLAHVTSNQQALAELLERAPVPDDDALLSLRKRLADSSCCDAERAILDADGLAREAFE